MASTTKEDVANEALINIGEQEIDAFNDATDRAKVVNRLYDTALDEVLSDSFWGFAKKFLPLTKANPQPLSIPGDFSNAFVLPNDFIRSVGLQDNEEFDIYSHFATIADGPNTLTSTGTTVSSTAHGLAVNDWIHLDGGDQKSEIRRVTTVTDANNVEIEEPFTSDQTAAVAWKKASGSKNYLITDADSPKLEYVARITDPMIWEPMFKQALIKNLEAKFMLAIVHSVQGSRALLEEYQLTVSLANTISGQNANRPRKIEATTLLDVRGGARHDKVLSRH